MQRGTEEVRETFPPLEGGKNVLYFRSAKKLKWGRGVGRGRCSEQCRSAATLQPTERKNERKRERERQGARRKGACIEAGTNR